MISNKNGLLVGGLPLSFADFRASWAGEGRRAGEICLGSFNSQLIFQTVKGESRGEFSAELPDAEAVNGVAFIRSHIAVGTRENLTVWTIINDNPPRFDRMECPFGVHGVMTTADGQIVAPAGFEGLLILEPGKQREQSITVSRPNVGEIYFYKIASLYSLGRPEILAVAGRKTGLAALRLEGDEAKSIYFQTFPDVDIVDICSLGSGALPPAAVALTLDGTMLFFKNILTDYRPVPVKFPEVVGRPYRILSSKGHVFLLTSRGLHLFPDLAKRFLEGDPIQERVMGTDFPIEAIDANICWEDWLLIVTSKVTFQFNIDELIGRPGNATDLKERKSVRVLQPEGCPHRAEMVAV